MTILNDGTVLSSNTPISEKDDYSNILAEHGFYKAIVLNTYYRDSKQNKSKTQTEYKIRIVGSELSGREFPNVIAIDSFGSPVNFSEKIYTAKTKKIKSNKDGVDAKPQDFNNSYVMVTFINGSTPTIISAWTHPAKKVLSSTETTGERVLNEYNGIRYHINKDGELLIHYTGGTRETGLNTDHPTGKYKGTEPLQIKIDKTGTLTILDKSQQEIKLDRVNNKILLTQYAGSIDDESSADYQDYDKTPSGAIVNQIEMDKNNGKVIIHTERTDIGDATLEHIVKDVMLCTFLNNFFKQLYDQHRHLDSLGYLTSPPDNAGFITATGADIASLKHYVE